MNEMGIVNEVEHDSEWDIKMNKLLTVNWFIVNCKGVYE